MPPPVTIDYPDDATPDDLIPAVEAARLMPSVRPGKRLHVATIYRWVNTGRLRGWKTGRWTFVSKADVLALMRVVVARTEAAKEDVPQGRPPAFRKSQSAARKKQEQEVWDRLRKAGIA